MKRIIPNISRPSIKKALKWAAISLAVYAIAGFIILPLVIKPVLVKKLSEGLHRQVTAGEIKVNPFVLSVTVKGVVIKNPNGKGTFVSFDELYINLQSLSLVKKGIILKEIRLARPYINVIRNDDLSYNFSDLLEHKGPKTEPPKFSLNNIRITDGSVDFYDGPTRTRHRLTDINITVPFVSNLGYFTDTFVQPSFSAKVNGTPVSFKGEIKPFSDSLETSLGINLNNLNLPHYLGYSPVKMGFKVPSGYLDVDLGVSYRQYKDGRPPSLSVKGDAVLKELVVRDVNGGPLVSIPFLGVTILSSDIMNRYINIGRVRIDSPRVDVVRDQAGRINLLSLLPEKPAGPMEEKPPSAPLSVSANQISITNGAVSLSDDLVKGGFKTLLRPVDLTVVNFNTQKDWKTTVALGLKTDAGEDIMFNGEVVLDPLKARGALNLDNIPLKRYSPYYNDAILFDVQDGRLGLSTGLIYSSVKESPETELYGLSVSLSSLKLKKRDEQTDFLDIPELKLEDTSVDLVKKAFTLGGLYTRGGFIGLRRYKDGNLNIMRLMKASGLKGGKAAQQPSRKPEKPWDATLKGVAVDSWTLRMYDMWPPQPATLTAEDLKLRADDISTAKDAVGKVSLSFKPNGKGSFSTSGTASINPVLLNLKIDLKDVLASSMEPYFSDRIKIKITDGRVAADGSLMFGYSSPRGLKLKYTGNVSMHNFVSIDKQGMDEFLKWKALGLKGMEVSYSPNYVGIKEVALSDFSTTIIVNQDKTLNLLNVLSQGAPAKEGGPAQQKTPAVRQARPAPAPPPPPPPPSGEARLEWPARVDKITLHGGRINISDRSISPTFSSNLSGIGGSVTGLSSEETKMAGLDLRGTYDNSAPIEITGRLNPLRKDLYVDLKVRFTGMDLSPVTPYSAKYLGYKIAKGKLSLDLDYHIVKKDLDSKNKIFIDQMTLGDAVESPDATKLPVKLALALLRDRNGEIHLDVPVTGRTDNPKFSIAKIIIRIIWNLIVKAATSPFALLGSIFGGGEELGYVEFEPGSYTVDAQGLKKLDTLAKALYGRPALKLSIEGHVDAEKDREGLRRYLFEKKLKAQKLKDMLDKGQPAVPVEDVKIEPKEYDKYLRMAYKAEKFPKPKSFLIFTKSLPPAEMEKLMLANIKVSDDDLRQLAARRAEKVRDYVLGSGKAGPERVFMVEPKSLAPERKKGLKDSRVTFTLE